MGEPARPKSNAAWLALVPAVIAGTLAFIYALGAIAVYGQAAGADFSGEQVMPLVPVEQILGHGIGSIASLFWRTAGELLVFVFLMVVYWGEGDNGVSVAHPKEWGRPFRYGVPVALAILAVIQPWEEAAVLAIGAASLAGCWALGWALKLKGWKAFLVLTCASIVAVVPMSIASSILKPAPLPDISLIQSDSPTLHGELIAETGSNWYVGMPDGSVRAIPNRRTTRASITYPKRTRPPSLIERIFD